MDWMDSNHLRIGGIRLYSSHKGFALDYALLLKNAGKVLNYAFQNADTFSVITDLAKPYSKIPPNCKQDEWTAPLQEYLISQTIGVKEWPGTITRSNRKVLSTYQSCKQTRDIVKSWPNVLNACEYGLPEDICFYRGEKLLLGTTSHEETADALNLSKEDEEFFCLFKK